MSKAHADLRALTEGSPHAEMGAAKTGEIMRIIASLGASGTVVVLGTVDSKPVAGESIVLRDARMILRWGRACGGLFGLASDGPSGPRAETLVTTAVPQTCSTTWTDWTEVTADADAAICAWADQ